MVKIAAAPIPPKTYLKLPLEPPFFSEDVEWFEGEAVTQPISSPPIFTDNSTCSTPLIHLLQFGTSSRSWSLVYFLNMIAIVGIGSKNLIPVPVDDAARMDIDQLKESLKECVEKRQAVYAVVAILGSTEHGACDPLGDCNEAWNELYRFGLININGVYSLNIEIDRIFPIRVINIKTRKLNFTLRTTVL
ncbi:6683_t:CDS:2 [Funneliformis caledonium]|uniref:6683_t:CDS:1 n=1 Tax=Funneliformis caledonium TaxID=1117310 RepID=A0A9N9H6C2_9GLOM|nr:6683_t:CDS:2 [Funneliformis caledonium]